MEIQGPCFFLLHTSKTFEGIISCELLRNQNVTKEWITFSLNTRTIFMPCFFDKFTIGGSSDVSFIFDKN